MKSGQELKILRQAEKKMTDIILAYFSRWTCLLELAARPAAQSRHHLRTVRMTAAEGTPLREA